MSEWEISDRDNQFREEQQYMVLLAIFLAENKEGTYLERLKQFLEAYEITEERKPHLWMFFMEKWL